MSEIFYLGSILFSLLLSSTPQESAFFFPFLPNAFLLQLSPFKSFNYIKHSSLLENCLLL